LFTGYTGHPNFQENPVAVFIGMALMYSIVPFILWGLIKFRIIYLNRKPNLENKKSSFNVLFNKIENNMAVDAGKKIKEAKELLDIGAISQSEFDEIKKKYIDKF